MENYFQQVSIQPLSTPQHNNSSVLYILKVICISTHSSGKRRKTWGVNMNMA